MTDLFPRDHHITIEKPPDIPVPGWYGVDTTANLRRLHAEQAAARAKTPPAPEPVDPWTALQSENRELRAKVRQLEDQNAALVAELASKAPPHLRKLEKR